MRYMIYGIEDMVMVYSACHINMRILEAMISGIRFYRAFDLHLRSLCSCGLLGPNLVLMHSGTRPKASSAMEVHH